MLIRGSARGGAGGGRAPGHHVKTNVALLFFFRHRFPLSSSTRERFYPQRPSGQDVVTGVAPSPPQCVPSFLSSARMYQHSHFSAFYARRFSSIFSNSRSRAFHSSQRFAQEKVPTRTSMPSGRFEPASLTLVGTISSTTPHGTLCLVLQPID